MSIPSLFSLTSWWVAAVALPHDFQTEVPTLAERLKGPASVYANLTPTACKARLKTADREHAFAVAPPARGIAAAVRMVGPISGVTFQVPAPGYSFGLLDCRVALLLLELAPQLAQQGVTSLRVDGFYRPGARLGGKRSVKSQHAYGLALDVVSLKVRTTSEQPVLVEVANDFYGKRGEPPCGPEAQLHLPPEASPAALERALTLRNLVCRLGRGGWFHHILTANYNQAHESHLHLDIKRDCRWMSLD